MDINYTNDIFIWTDEQDARLSKPHDIFVIAPNSQLLFESKLKEIIEQYQFAREILRQIDNGRWDCWFPTFKEQEKNKIFQTGFNEYFLETSILYYNIVVDLTWVLFFGCAGYAIEKRTGKKVSITKIMGLQDAQDAFRKLEDCIFHPTGEADPFRQITKEMPKFNGAVTLITNFWNQFRNDEIRNLYNFIKHKGKPQYTEMYKLVGRKPYSIHIGETEIPTDLNDTRRVISLYGTAEKLVKFDNEKLFPYCDSLIKTLLPLAYEDKSI